MYTLTSSLLRIQFMYLISDAHCYTYIYQGRSATEASIAMAEMVSSVVIQESFSQIISGLVQKYEEKEETNEIRHIERLEMAHIRLEAALETSEKWQITDASLLHRRKKLKRAAQDCGTHSTKANKES